MTERKLTNKILKYLQGEGIFFKYHGGYGGNAGVPDIIGVIQGRFIALEIKKNQSSRVTKLQEYNIKQIRRHGGEAFIVWDFQKLKELIKSLKKIYNKEKHYGKEFD